jgi:hypothetical protein
VQDSELYRGDVKFMTTHSRAVKEVPLRSTGTTVDMMATIESFRVIIPAEPDKALLS